MRSRQVIYYLTLIWLKYYSILVRFSVEKFGQVYALNSAVHLPRDRR